MYPKGADISYHQDSNETEQFTDFNKMKDAGVEFVFIRAGQSTWYDEDYIRNFRESGDILPRGPYWFFGDDIKPSTQSEHYRAIIEEAGGLGELQWAIDLEKTQWWPGGVDGPYANWRYWKNFIWQMMQHYPGVRPAIYTGYWYWIEHTDDATDEELQWFADNCDLWIGAISATPETLQNYIPRPFKKATVWQYTWKGDGPEHGVESQDIDLDYYVGDDFASFIGGEPTTPPEADVYKGTVQVSLYLRDAPYGNPLGALVPGQKVTADKKYNHENGSVWWNIIEPRGWSAASVVGKEPYIVEDEPVDEPDYIVAHWDDGREKKYVPDI